MATFTQWFGGGYESKFHNTPFSATPTYTVCGKKPALAGNEDQLSSAQISDKWSPTAFQWNVAEGNMCKKCYSQYLENKKV